MLLTSKQLYGLFKQGFPKCKAAIFNSAENGKGDFGEKMNNFKLVPIKYLSKTYKSKFENFFSTTKLLLVFIRVKQILAKLYKK